MQNAELDYQFGWCWLLSGLTGNRVVCHGLCEDEQQWWAQTHSLTLVSRHADSVDGYLIALETADAVDLVNAIHKANPKWFCAWGSGSSINRLRSSLELFGTVREYGLLPARKPRVVVPLSSPQNAVAGLRLHRPGRFLARVGLFMARGFARFGFYGILRERVLMIAERAENVSLHDSVQAGMNISILSKYADYALYLGTPDDYRKTVVLPLGGRALPSVIFKVAETPKTQAALRNEAQALTAMGVTLLAGQVPKLIRLEKVKRRLTLVQEFRQRHSVGQARMTHAAINFLAGLSHIDRKQVWLSDWLKVEAGAGKPILKTSLSLATESAAAKMSTRLAMLADNGQKIFVHRCHGDFAPWNCAWTSQGFFVYDWEQSREQSLAMSDAFYYVMSACVHVQKNPNVQQALVQAIDFAAEVATQSGIFAASNFDCEDDVRIHLALWLLERLEQSPFYGELLVRLVQGWK